MAYSSDENISSVKISGHVVAVIAGIAATEVEGVVSLKGNITNEFVARMGFRTLEKGVDVVINEDSVFANIRINVSAGCNIPKLCEKVQEKAAQAIEIMTGLYVSEINVIVAGVTM